MAFAAAAAGVRVLLGLWLGLLVLAAAQPAADEPAGGPSDQGDLVAHKLRPSLEARLAHEPGPVKAWVFFQDKGVHTPEELAAALATVKGHYNMRAVQRRAWRARGATLFDEQDLPIPPAYLAAIEATGARVHVQSKWVNAVSAWVTREQAAQIAALPFVRALQAVGRARQNLPVEINETPPEMMPALPAESGLNYGASAAQLDQINVIALHEAGYTGEGVIIGVLDTGFRRTHAAFNDPNHPLQVIAEYDFVDDDTNAGQEAGDAATQHEHGTLILGCIGAYLPGSLVGGAYDASFILCKTEDVTGEYPAEEDNYVAGLEFVEEHGGDMVTASLGYIDWYTQADLDGETAVTTIAVNAATAKGMHCLNAAGNEGHDSSATTSSLIAPADALQVITCGAVDGDGDIASFSSDGPTADGRVKPELLARGVETWTVSAFLDQSYVTAAGTSLSTPLVACAVACLIQARPTWTVDEMRDRLFETADYVLAHGTFDPLYVQGYGIVNAYGAIADCNENGTPDVLDIADGTSTDTNDNAIPDECELDCNGNSKPDLDDIADGQSLDCNGNRVPDECDITDGTSTDANDNDVPDECDADCNENRQPDDLDIADGDSQDCNANGQPDECELTRNDPLVQQWSTTGSADYVVAQDFTDVGYAEYNTKAWDDFTIGSDVVLTMGEAYFWTNDAASFGFIRFLVEIATAPGGAEAGASVVLSTIGSGVTGTQRVEWDFGGATLPAGTYWISVQAVGGFSVTGQVYWRRANLSRVRGSEHYMHNPGGAWGESTDPEPGSAWFDTPADLAFFLYRRTEQDCNANGVPDVCETNLAPTITQQPEDLSVFVGDAVQLAVTALGAAPLTWQWHHDGEPIPGATAAELTIAAAELTDSGEYDVLITGPCGSAASAPIELRVAVRPPGVPSSPSPADGATDVPTNVSLRWASGEGATLHKLLLQQDPNAPFVFLGNTTGETWTPETPLAAGSTVHWQVLARNGGGTTPGPIWSFTTAAPGVADEPASAEPNEPAQTDGTTGDGTAQEPTETPNGDQGELNPPLLASSVCPTTSAALISLTLLGLWRTRPTRSA